MIEKELDKHKLRVYSNGKIERFYRNCYWRELTSNSNCNNGYCTVKINKKMYKKHRIIGWAFLDLDITNSKIQVDHIDRNKLNNKLSNLRIVTNQQNMFNRSNVKGYSWNKLLNKWTARIYVDKKKKYLGHYATEDEAHNAYLNSKVKHHII